MKIIIDGKQCEAKAGEFILDVARRNGIEIPTLCHSDALPGQGSCRLCIVEVIERGRSRVVTSCIFPITREVEVLTKSEKIINMRKTIIMLLSLRTPQNEYMEKLRKEYGIEDKEIDRFNVDRSEECILCGLCVRACEAIGTNAISTVNRGISKKISTPFDEPSKECIGCAACAGVCPTGAIKVCDSHGHRTIWNKEFKLIKCEKCGKYFATQEQTDYINHKLGTETNEMLCEKCRRTLLAENLKNVFENTPTK
jgi:bidirectional [NiFe] hydrogenase diaphorase subunit